MTYPHPDNDFDDVLNPAPARGFGQITEFRQGNGEWTGTKGVDLRLIEAPAGNVKLIYFTITPCDPTKQMIYIGTSPKRTVATNSRDWLEQTESIKAMFPKAKNYSDVLGAWVAFDWTPRKSNKAGQDWKYPKLIKVFASQAKCEAAWLASKGDSGDSTPQSTQSTADIVNDMFTAAEQPKTNVDANKAALVAAFPLIWKANGCNVEKFKTAIASVFPGDAPEVADFVAKMVTEEAENVPQQTTAL